MSMAVTRQVDIRKNQKDRTRAAIVEAAIAVLRTGVTPTVIAAAEEAKVSRATAYRYFPTQEALLSEVMSITPSLETFEEEMRQEPSQDPYVRLERFLDGLNSAAIRNEAEYRAALRHYLDIWFEAKRKTPSAKPTVRAGRRRRYIESALAPIADTLPSATRRRLSNALSLTFGIDSLVIMKDTCGLDDEEALEVLQWTARVILDAGLKEAQAQKVEKAERR